MSDRRRVAVSPTKLDVWQQCAYRFRLQYVDKAPAAGAWAHLSMGNAIHAALRDWFDDDHRTSETAERLVRTRWSDLGFRDAEHSANWREVAAGMAGRYVAEHAGDAPVSRERTLGTLTENVTVSGRIDRIDERDGEFVIVDYKTGSSIPTTADAKVRAPWRSTPWWCSDPCDVRPMSFSCTMCPVASWWSIGMTMRRWLGSSSGSTPSAATSQRPWRPRQMTPSPRARVHCAAGATSVRCAPTRPLSRSSRVGPGCHMTRTTSDDD
jgi:hypothetical protein